MLITREISKSGDPSDRNQLFKELKINILCCRYWWFEIWKGQRMSFPYWRLYWNKNAGAYVYYEKKTPLLPNHIYLIPPRTPFSTGIQNQRLFEESEYFFKCGKINSREEEDLHVGKGNILHLFIHFTLGFPYDRALPGIYKVELTNKRQKALNTIVAKLIDESNNFHLKESLGIYNLVLSAIGSLSESIWSEKKEDQRIISTLDFLEKNSKTKITSQMLADRTSMSKSAFLRLFKSNTGKSPSKHLLQLRIDKACNLLHHTSSSIDTIAEQCGFSDRYHLSKVFKRIKKTSPAAFRNRIGYY